jgi:hypothetical protein
VCWLGGWTKHQLFYLVMVVRVVESDQAKTRDAAISDAHVSDRDHDATIGD